MKSMLPDRRAFGLEIRNSERSGKSPNIWRQNDVLLNNLHIKGEVARQGRRHVRKRKRNSVAVWGGQLCGAPWGLCLARALI